MRHQIWRKLVSLTLAFALVLGMIPAIPGAVHVANAAVPISEILIDELRNPRAGDMPDYDANLNSQRIEAYNPGTFLSRECNNGIVWQEVSIETGAIEVEKTLSPNDTFALGNTYQVSIFIKPAEGEVYSDSVTAGIQELTEGYHDATVTTPNGNSNADYKVVTYIYGCTRSAIETVEITDLEMPEAGKIPDTECTIETEHVSVNGTLDWIVDKGNGPEIAETAFEAGYTYKLSLYLRSDFAEGYFFKMNGSGENIVQVNINGIPFEIVDTVHAHAVEVWQEFYVPYTTVDTVDVVGLDEPASEKKPDFTAVPAAAGYDITDVTWLDVTDTPAVELGENDTFQEKHQYRVKLTVEAQQGYALSYDSSPSKIHNFKAKINGKDATLSGSYDGNPGVFYYTFDMIGEPIDSVALTMEGHELKGLIRGLTFNSNDQITVGSEYGPDKNYVVYLGNTSQHLTSETGQFYGWQQYYVGYYLEANQGYDLSKLTYHTVTMNGQKAHSLVPQDDGRVLAIFALEKLGYIHEIELKVPLPAAGQQITKPTVVSVDGDPNLTSLVTTEGSQWSASSFFIDGAEYEEVNSGNFQNGMAYKLELEACPADTNTYYLADDCTVTVKTSDEQILQRGQTWAQYSWGYEQTNYFNLNAPTTYDTLKNWDIEFYGYSGGASLLGISATVKANGKTLAIQAGENCMIYEDSFAEPEPPYSIKYDTQYTLYMVLLTADMNWPGVDWMIDDINNVRITFNGQPLGNGDLMNIDGDWWVAYKLPILSEKLETPKNLNLSTVTSTGYPKLTWDKVEGADKYEVWRKVGSSGTYKKQYTTTGTSYTNSSATPGTVYYYKVKAIHSNEECNSAFSGEKYIACDLAQPKNVKLTTVTSTGYPKLTWDKVEGADKYEVWRKVGSSGTYKRQYTTTGTSYTNSSTTPGTVYYYKVKAICEKNSGGNSAFSGEKSIACDLAQPKNLKVTTVASSGKPKVTWSKVEGATKYEVWRKVGSSGTYAKFYTTTGTSMTNTSATAGKAYYYKVKAICGKNSGGNSAFSASDYVTCDLAAPKITVSGTKKPGKIVVSWSKVTGADRYYIYRSTSKNGTYSKYSSTTSTTWTNTSVTKGKIYYYKVKAIYDGKSAANSAYSNMDYAKVR